MKILVTGSSGFIGSHLVKAIKQNENEVIAFDIRQSPLYDINNMKALERVMKKTKPDVIIHLAAISNRQDALFDPELTIKTNILGTFNVLVVGHKCKVRTIVASSAATDEPKLSLYGTTKQSVEQLTELFPLAFIARFYNVYGPHSLSVVNRFASKIKRGDPIVLNGNTVRDYIYVDDVCRALQQLAQDAVIAEKVNYVGTGVGTSLEKLVTLLEDQFGKKAIIVQGEPVKEIQTSVCNPMYTDYYTIPLEQGVQKLLSELNSLDDFFNQKEAVSQAI